MIKLKGEEEPLLVEQQLVSGDDFSKTSFMLNDVDALVLTLLCFMVHFPEIT